VRVVYSFSVTKQRIIGISTSLYLHSHIQTYIQIDIYIFIERKKKKREEGKETFFFNKNDDKTEYKRQMKREKSVDVNHQFTKY